MKIAIFSDIHGNLQALETIIKDIKLSNIDEIISLGDTIGIGPNPRECIDLLIENNINMVQGNHEMYCTKDSYMNNKATTQKSIDHHKWMKEQIGNKEQKFIENCPISISKNIYGKKILFQHFLTKIEKADYPFFSLEILRDNKIEEIFNNLDTDYMFIGHEHIAFEIKTENKKLIDVGSSGCTKDNKTFYTVLNIEENNVAINKKYMEYDRKKFENILKTLDYPAKKETSKNFFGMILD